MNSSKEELIELAEIERDKTMRKDPANSVISISTLTTSEEADLVNIFSVTPKTHSRRPGSSDRRTISEISDDVFLVKPESKQSTRSKKNYKEKISEHLRKIRERATTSSDLARRKIPIGRIRSESEQLDNEIDTVRSKYRDREKNRRTDGFFNFSADSNIDEMKDPSVYFSLPEKLRFSMVLAEKECFFNPHRMKPVQERQKNGSQSEDIPKIPNRQKNVLEARFSSVDDRRWFDGEGNLNFIENTLTRVSLRPSNYTLNDSYIVKYVPPSTRMNVELNEVVIVDNGRILNVHLSHLKFHHHPLFSAENVFAEKLKSSFEKYKCMLEENSLQKLKSNLGDLREKRCEQAHSSSLAEEIKKSRNLYFKESKRYKELVLTILETWKLVKKIRLNQKFANTSVKLLIKKEKTDVEAEDEEYIRMFENSFEEMLKEHGNEDNIEDGSVGEGSTSTSKDEAVRISLKNQLKKTMRSCLKAPGEPNLLFALTSDNEITENPDFAKEISRRNVISSTKFYLRILCNNIEACKTKFLSLTEDFSLQIEEIFSLQLTHVPKYLIVEVYEQPKSLLKKKLCEISVDVPQSKNNPVRTFKSHFEKDDILHYKHEGVGSGTDLKSIVDNYDLKLTNIKNYELKTSGYLEIGIEWEKVETIEENNSLRNRIQQLDEMIDKDFVIDYDKVNECFETGKSVSDNQTGGCLESENIFFRLNPCDNIFAFCHITEIEENLRLKILHLRDRKEIEFDGMLVPNRLKEIPLNTLSQYLRRKAGEEKTLIDDNMGDLRSQYYYGKKYLQQVRVKVFQLCKNTENNLDYESVVNENYLVHFHFMIKTLLRNFFNWFRWRPKISKPLPILHRVGSQDNLKITNANLKISIKILSAKNIPKRKKNIFNEHEIAENEVCPFVEVSYRNIFARTSTGKGCNPVWNEELVIPLESSHMDYLNPNSLEGVITVNLFDESDMEVKKLNKKCMNWLGEIDILLSAVCCSDYMNGFFLLKVPYVLLDYELQGEKSQKSSGWHPYLQMEIRLEPSIPKLSPNMEELPCGDVPYIQEHVLKWNRTFNDSFPHRKFNALVFDTNGKTTCVTRFIKSLEPPQINTEEFDVTVEQCCRYVSLIPFTESNHFYNNIWLSTDQLIKFMLGSVVDHAVALTCYLTALKLEAWLVLGYGIPSGNTACVLILEYSGDTPLSTYYLLDVVSNEKYNVLDENCPLQRIFCAINGKNVWANIQKTDNITLTRFDFNRGSDWLLLFDKNTPAPTNFVPQKVTYRPKEDTEMLEMKLENQLKRQISKLRLLDRTTWNSGLSNVLTNALRTFEMNCMYNKNQRNETLTELYQDISPYAVSGFAINTHFTNLSALMRKIKKLGIHVQQEKDIEFALAVHIHSYHGALFSVWMFLVVIRNND